MSTEERIARLEASLLRLQRTVARAHEIGIAEADTLAADAETLGVAAADLISRLRVADSDCYRHLAWLRARKRAIRERRTADISSRNWGYLSWQRRLLRDLDCWLLATETSPDWEVE